MTIYAFTLVARCTNTVVKTEYRASDSWRDAEIMLALQYGYANIEEFEDDWLVLWEEI